MDVKEAIAVVLTKKGLPTEVSQVKTVLEMYKVYNVVIVGRRARFVSKVAVVCEMLEASLKASEPVSWTLRAEVRRQEGKKWVARIDGNCDERDGLKRTFINAHQIEWGKYGMKEATFLLQEPGYYHDSDGDYFKVFYGTSGLDAETCSKLEVLAHFGLSKV